MKVYVHFRPRAPSALRLERFSNDRVAKYFQLPERQFLRLSSKTAVNVKLLLSPRQSRGTSLGG
jgi:hypothetical protein